MGDTISPDPDPVRVTPPTPKNPDRVLFLGIFSLGVCILFFVLQANGVDVNWQVSAFTYAVTIVACTWSFLSHAVPHISRPKRYIGAFLFTVLLAALAFYGTAKEYRREHRGERQNVATNQIPVTAPSEPTKSPVEPSLDVEIAPLVIIKPRQERIGGQIVRGTDYGFATVLRVVNYGTSRQFVRKLEVSGDIEADCGDYERIFGEQNGTHEVGYLAKQCAALRPFLRLLWTAYPSSSGSLDPNGDQQFIRFVFLHPQGMMRSRAVDEKFYFGLRAFGGSPQFLTTAPYLLDLVRFTRVSPDHVQMGGFMMRDEVKGGAVRFIVTLAASRITIPPAKIRPASDVFYPWLDSATYQDLFYGTEDKMNPLPVPVK